MVLGDYYEAPQASARADDRPPEVAAPRSQSLWTAPSWGQPCPANRRCAHKEQRGSSAFRRKCQKNRLAAGGRERGTTIDLAYRGRAGPTWQRWLAVNTLGYVLLAASVAIPDDAYFSTFNDKKGDCWQTALLVVCAERVAALRLGTRRAGSPSRCRPSRLSRPPPKLRSDFWAIKASRGNGRSPRSASSPWNRGARDTGTGWSPTRFRITGRARVPGSGLPS